MKKWIGSVGLVALVTGCGSPLALTPGITKPVVSNVSDTANQTLPISSTVTFKLSGTVSVNGQTMTPSIISTSSHRVQTGSYVSFVDPQVQDAASLIQVDVYLNGTKETTLTPAVLLQSNGYTLSSPGTYKFVISAAHGLSSGTSTSTTIRAVGDAPKPFQLSFSSNVDNAIQVHVTNYSQAGETMKISYTGVPSAYTLEGAYYTGGYAYSGIGISNFKIDAPVGNSTRNPLSFFIPEVLGHSTFRIVLTFMNPQGNILVAESGVLQTG